VTIEHFKHSFTALTVHHNHHSVVGDGRAVCHPLVDGHQFVSGGAKGAATFQSCHGDAFVEGFHTALDQVSQVEVKRQDSPQF
jgi:hypothetical protein